MDFKPPQHLIVSENAAGNWKLFKQKFHNFLKATGNDEKTDHVKIAMLLTCIGDEALDVYNTFKLSSEDADKYDKVISAFDEFCEPRKNVIFNRYKFFSRKQELDEPFDIFLISLRKLAKTCDFKEEDDLIRDRIVIGINDDSLKERLLRLKDLTLTDAINNCKAAETSKQQVQELNSKHDQLNSIKNKSVFKKKTNEKNTVHDSTFDCRYCGRNHEPRNCPAFGKSCDFCGRRNHFSNVCQRKMSKKVYECAEGSSQQHKQEDETDFIVESLFKGTNNNNSWLEPILIGGKQILCKLDTGAQCNVLPYNVYKSLCVNSKLLPTNSKILTYGNQALQSCGIVYLDAVVRNKMNKIKFIVVDIDNDPILGLNACIVLKLLQRLDNITDSSSASTLKCYTNKDQFIEDNKSLFNGVGSFATQLKLELKDNAVPIINPVRRVPEAIKPKLKEQLDKLVADGVITPVHQPTDWVNNIVIIEKPDKSLRICLDPANLNSSLKVNPYPIPTSSELELLLKGKKYYSVFDMKDGFHHVVLEPASRLLTSFITPFGKFMYNKLPFGLNISPEVFQRYNTQVFGDIPNLGIYFDDFIIATDTEAEHDSTLNMFLKRAKESNVRFNPKKLQFKVKIVKYLGLIFSEDGVKPDPDRVQSIVDLDEPKNKKELLSVLGSANFLSKFIPNMSDITAPLRQLLKKHVDWNWSDVHKKAFDRLKNSIQFATTLKIFDLNLPVEVFVDASGHALGCCLIQNKHPVAFGSRALSTAETKYPTIDKELAALCFAMSKFHNYIYGNPNVTIYTDHKPIIGIMDKAMCCVSNRLQKFKLKLLPYNVRVKYLPGSENILADLMSRYVRNINCKVNESIIDDCIMVHSLTNQLSMSEEKKNEFRTAYKSDTILMRVVGYLHSTWPDFKKLETYDEMVYFKNKNSLLFEDGLLFLNQKVVVPQALRRNMLNLIHETHLGLNKCKARARSVLYWPKMCTEIEQIVLSCKICEEFRNRNGKEPMLSQPKPSRPWQRISSDILEYGGKPYLVVVDSYSNWIELEKLPDKTAVSVVAVLKNLFSRFGVPEIFLSDNVPFSSQMFKDFAKHWNFVTITSSPFYPRGNGLAEKSVSIAKGLLRRASASNLDISVLLLEYRNSPLTNVNLSPAQLFLNRNLKSKLPVTMEHLKPRIVTRTFTNEKSQNYYNRTANHLKEFQTGDSVLFLKNNKWFAGRILKKHQFAPRNYIVQDRFGNTFRRNRIFLRKSYSSDDDIVVSQPSKPTTLMPASDVNVQQKHPVVTRCGREVKRPERYKDFV